MSNSDALLNLIITIVVMTPFSLLSWWTIHKTPLEGLTGTEKLRAYRVYIGAGSIILLNIGLVLYFVVNLITL